MSAATHEGSTFVRHLPCPSCGSSDANSLYDDGHTFCFVCGTYARDGEEGGEARPKGGRRADLITGEVRGIRNRKITDATAEKFGYMHGEFNGKPVHIAPYYDADGRMVAQKIRFADKSFVFLGDTDAALPFGAQAWPRGGRMIVVTEGEIDALAQSQVQGNKYPVVSIACGAGRQVRKYMAKHKGYFEGFETVVLMFDMDEPGREAAKIAAEVLGSRARIAELSLKDPSDMLKEGRVEEMVKAVWNAKPYRPEGIVDMASLKDVVKQRPKVGLTWPFESLTAMTYGIRLGEIYFFGAGTGIGKTDFFTQTMEHLVRVHGVKIGVIYMEQEPRETALRLAGKFAKRPFHIPDYWDDAAFDAAWDKLVKEGQVFLYDGFGTNEWGAIRDKIEYLVHAEGVRYFFLDHLTALAAYEDDERVALDKIMADMGALVKRLNITIFGISHLATPEGKPHEEGGRVMIRHFRGSRAIGFWSHYMFGLERDQQNEDEAVRMTTTFRCLKDRYTGRATGQVFYMGYDHESGMLFEKAAPDTAQEHGFKNETEGGDIPSDF